MLDKAKADPFGNIRSFFQVESYASGERITKLYEHQPGGYIIIELESGYKIIIHNEDDDLPDCWAIGPTPRPNSGA